MPRGPRPQTAPTWTVRSVSVRTRDGPLRLNQAYRRLLDPPPAPSRPGSPDPATPIRP